VSIQPEYRSLRPARRSEEFRLPHLQLHQPHGPTWVFFVIAIAICLVPWAAERTRVPPLLGLLAAGFVIGPHALGVVDAEDPLVPALGQLGLLYLMFMAGAELDFDVVRRYRSAVMGFSVLTFGAPMLLGFLCGLLFGFPVAAALLIGSLWASHTLLAYPTVRDAGLAAHPAVATTVGATVATDTASLAVLAGVAGFATGSLSGTDLVAQILVGLLVLAGWCLVVLPRLGRFFYTRVGFQPTIRYAFVLMALLSAAELAELLGVEAIVGAFFAGLGLNRLLPNHGRMFERIEFIGASLLIPLFLLSVGLVIDPSVITEPSTLALAAGFTIACLGGKGLAAVACRRLFGYTWPEVGVTFSLSSAQAAATLAATFVGFQVGLIGTTVVNAVIVVILVSVLVSSASADFFVARMQVVGRSARKLGDAVVLLIASMQSAVPAIDLAARLATADDGLVLPRVVSIDDSFPASRDMARLDDLIARRGLDGETVLRHAHTMADSVLHTCRDEHATAVVIAEPPEAFVDGASETELRQILDSCRVPSFLVAAERPFRHLANASDASCTSAAPIIDQLLHAGFEVDETEKEPATLARLFRRPRRSTRPDGSFIVTGPGEHRRVPPDAVMVVVAPETGR
jgi:Kef-type K+ transport system membrane component KefB